MSSSSRSCERKAALAFETFIGLRQLKARKHSRAISTITLVSVAGVVVGVWALVVVLSVMSGFEDDLRAKILGSNPHVVVDLHRGRLANHEAACRRLASLRNVAACAPFVSSEVMLTSATNLAGVVLRGIARKNASIIAGLAGKVSAGTFTDLFQPRRIRRKGNSRGRGVRSGSGSPLVPPLVTRTSARPGMVLGKELARNLSVEVGDEVRVVSPLGGTLTPLGPIPKTRRFKVAAIFFTGMYEYDSKLVYITIGEGQRFLSLGSAVTGLELRLDDVTKAGAVKQATLQALGGYPHRVRDWTDLNHRLFAALRLEKVAMFVILTFIIVVASFSIVSTLVMVVIEKAREIAILKSMGARAGSVMSVFVIQGAVVGIAGTVIGLALGLGTCSLLAAWPIRLSKLSDVYYLTKLPVRMDGPEILLIALAAVVLCLLAAVYPAAQATRLRPAEGLRYE